MFDAHCHLDFPDFDADRRAMLQRALEAGVRRFMVPGTTRARWPGVMSLAEREDIVVSLGLHPYFIYEHRTQAPRAGASGAGCGDADESALDDLQALERALSQGARVVGIGECGIDARFEATLSRQWEVFEAQLQLAKHFRLPVVVHCVHAEDAVAKRLRQLALPAGGLIHAFGGSPQQAQRFVDLGYTLGIGGSVTYSRARRLHRSVASLPDDAFVLETDSPDMPLCGHQGRRNEPYHLGTICEHIALLRDQSREEVAAATTQNACRLFGL
ncbi:TatD family hydrolase [Salinicola aestuarinus]|uniref:TatD family hydrolase n=1 Tax=Salinicola aestuarinus TaxID=1949082 RepID=UPI000DA1F777|nr:TatD family hydrolase [Salinicola aestuarinus]